MSRIGKQPITVPQGVKVELNKSTIKVSGPKGSLEYDFPESINVSQDGNIISVTRNNNEREARSLHGLVRTLINNNITGVTTGFKKELEIIGVGYRVALKGKDILSLYLGYSHTNEYFIPQGVMATIEPKQNKIVLESCDKQLLGEVASQIRRLRPPEPYKGKGVRYSNEVIRKKVGKAVVGR